MEQSYLHFWGVRGSHSAPFASHLKVGGNTSCVELNLDGYRLVCDAGTGIIPLGNQLLAAESNKNLLIILTHYHWDHICGLPFFKPAFNSDWTISFFAPGESAEDIKQKLAAQMKAPYFPVGTDSWLANVNYLDAKQTEINCGTMAINYFTVNHPGITYGYKISVHDKTVIYVSDNECQFLDDKSRQAGFMQSMPPPVKAISPKQYEAELDKIRSADILIHDAQYTPEDYQKKRGWGHSCYVDVIHYAIDAGVKALYLYHHDPAYDDTVIEQIYQNSQHIINSRHSSLKCYVAREGLEIALGK